MLRSRLDERGIERVRFCRRVDDRAVDLDRADACCGPPGRTGGLQAPHERSLDWCAAGWIVVLLKDCFDLAPIQDPFLAPPRS